MAVAKVKRLGLGARLRMMVEYREKARRDLWAIKETARIEGREQGLIEGLEQGIEQGLTKGLEQGLTRGLEQGRQKGLEEGRQEALLETARKFRDMGLSVEQIAKVTGLPPEAIQGE